ncbi:hypothetical protein PG994_012560 [Apiospora phragmitis]|uniref:Uncharacterized protein n=1 Tax=Apiospora phragmitis TaxID=2905665 RepID=A0ABR1TAU0_9PEZI
MYYKRFTIVAAIFAAAIGATAANTPMTCDECCNICLGQVGNGIADNLELGNCWGNCAVYACSGTRCANEKYNP